MAGSKFQKKKEWETWKTLADLYIKCLWLEEHYDNGNHQTWCYTTTTNSSRYYWLGFITKHMHSFSDYELGSFAVGPKLSIIRR